MTERGRGLPSTWAVVMMPKAGKRTTGRREVMGMGTSSPSHRHPIKHSTYRHLVKGGGQMANFAGRDSAIQKYI